MAVCCNTYTPTYILKTAATEKPRLPLPLPLKPVQYM